MADFTTEWETPEFDSVPSLSEEMVYLLPGCDAVLIRKALQSAYRDFCKRGAALRTWRKIVLPHDDEGMLRAVGSGFAVVPVLSGEIDCVTQVVCDCMGVRRDIRGWSFVGHPPGLVFPHPSRHDFFIGRMDGNLVQHRPNVGTLPPEVRSGRLPPPMPALLWVEAVEIPHIGEERAPREFLQRYGDALVDGALARLFSMTGRAWTDAEQARQRGVAYTNALSEARQRSMCGGSSANADGGFALDMGSMV